MANLTFDDEFDSLSGTWQPTWPGSPGGSSVLSAWFPNPSLVPADGNPVSINGGSLDLANYPRPADVSADSVGGQPRIGGQVNSSGNFSQTYGYFEVRAQLPSDPGYLGAIWMLPVNGGGTYSELDIAEVVSRAPSTLTYNVWRPNPDGGYVDVANTSQGFHTYAVDWEPDNITWYFDGQQIAQTTTPSYMNQPMFMILSNESGTNDSWGGAPDSGSSSNMLVDYVRAYNGNPYTNGGALTFQSGGNGTSTSSAGNTASGSTDNGTTSATTGNTSASGTTNNTTAASGSTDNSTMSAATNNTTASGSTDNTTAASGSTDNSTMSMAADASTTTAGNSVPNSGSSNSSNTSGSSSADSSTTSANIVDLTAGFSRVSATSAADIFVIDGSDHQARISDFTPGIDKLEFGMTAQDFSNVTIDTSSRGWAVVQFDGNRIYLPGVTPSQLSQSDFAFSSSQQ